MDSKVIEALLSSREITIPPGIVNSMRLTKRRLQNLGEEEFINDDLHAPAMHLLKSSGKLIRPGLVFSSAYMLSQKPEDFVDLAAGIELLHTASLIHDDIIDKDSVRRGDQAVHRKFGESKAILAGDALIAKAIQLTSPYGSKVVMRASEAAMAMCAGEILDHEQQQSRSVPDLQTYLNIARLKTAYLIGVSTSIVADYAGHGNRDVLYEIGTNIGYSFQIKDDIMNYVGAEDRAGKDVMNDAKNSRPNIISVFSGHGRDDPLKTAIKLNNFYIDASQALLESMDKSDIISPYLEFLRIKA